MPPKAVQSLRFVTAKNLGEYITEENMLTCWGGKDDYKYTFEPEKLTQTDLIEAKDENDNTTYTSFNKKVCNIGSLAGYHNFKPKKMTRKKIPTILRVFSFAVNRTWNAHSFIHLI